MKCIIHMLCACDKECYRNPTQIECMEQTDEKKRRKIPFFPVLKISSDNIMGKLDLFLHSISLCRLSAHFFLRYVLIYSRESLSC